MAQEGCGEAQRPAQDTGREQLRQRAAPRSQRPSREVGLYPLANGELFGGLRKRSDIVQFGFRKLIWTVCRGSGDRSEGRKTS